MATNAIFATAGPIEPILEHEIRIRAYELYEQHGARNGHGFRPSRRYCVSEGLWDSPCHTNEWFTDDREPLLRSIRSSQFKRTRSELRVLAPPDQLHRWANVLLVKA
jgi:hypothetical protein